MKRVYLLSLVIILVLTGTEVLGQDPQFSQFYNNPVLINPAAAGATRAARVVVSHRNQWPNVTSMITQTATFDYFQPIQHKDIGLGFGLIAVKDQAGNALRLKNESLGLQVAMEKPIEDYTRLRVGAQYVHSWKSLTEHVGTVTFEDQLLFGGTTTEELGDLLTGETRSYGSLSMGILGTHKNVWLGLGLHHLNQPDASIASAGDDNMYRLPVKYLLHGGIELNIKKSQQRIQQAIVLQGLYAKQGPNEQFIGGVRYMYGLDFNSRRMAQQKDVTLSAGLFLRSIPLFTRIDRPIYNTDAISGQLGIEFELNNISMDIGYAYDYAISKLNPNPSNEITLSIRFLNRFIWGVDCKKRMQWKNRSETAYFRRGLRR
ncbi:PorP/SprF family type IX secretion system membrane protein [Roseivirga sp. BDSF3-8]|uniref:PorP/SprF family type IX secretion system membrane protein n=1 Tax=Roseivirga sp. BDSF3-8 TaxID=3241598 RepID=UPI003532434A